MTPSSHRQIRIIGVGNEWRGDDAAGLLVARHLNSHHPGRFTAIECQGDASSLLETWKGCKMAIIADAVHSGGPPGTIYRFATPFALPFPFSPSCSSHSFGLAQALALGRVLQELPAVLVIYGIAGKDFRQGQGLSREVATAVPEVACRIAEEIRNGFRADCR